MAEYVPALGFSSLTRFYDPVLEWSLPERRFKRLLVEQAAIPAGGRVLDLGCGTGTLTLLLAEQVERVEVFGVDGDREVLTIARRKAADAGAEVTLVQALADDTGFESGSFDSVVSCLLFHHLDREQKLSAFRHVRDLLKPGGSLHVADWGQASGPLMRAAFLSIQLLDGFRTTSDNVRGELPVLMAEAGLREVRETHSERTMFGTLSLYSAGRGS